MVEQVRFEQFLTAKSAADSPGFAAWPADVSFRLTARAELSGQDYADWDSLGRAAASASAYAQPWFMRHSLEQCDPHGKARLAIVADSHGHWLGVLPLVRGATLGRAPLPSWQAWSHPNRFVGTPLVREGAAHAFWHELLDGLARQSRTELALCLSDLASDDPVNLALFDICAADDRVMGLDQRVSRALLRAGHPPELSAKGRRRIESLTRKLRSDFGEPEFRVIRDPAELAAKVDTFIALERSGWKGEGGSALGCTAANRALFGAIARDGASRGCFELAELAAGGRVLAQSTQLRGNGRRYGFKMAYDEDCAGYGPGLLLLNWLTQTFCADPAALAIDSCARPDQQPVSRLWTDRCELVDCRVALGGTWRQAAMNQLLRCEMLFSAIKRGR